MGSTETGSFLPLTPVAFHVLVTLQTEVSHGYAIKRTVEERTDGVVRLGAGTLYHAIAEVQRREADVALARKAIGPAAEASP
jgi:DNA-binding PadR family transcriptional regulator